ncbi:MAG: dephospho-CoA kinase [Sphingobacteriaceae bacterium]|nr:MAG: dephospho-CoA kinase [Sphingobacteriaceae bacterium]
MLKIGITGNIGSGKTTVSKLFELIGIPVFYADDAAKILMVTDEALIAGIKQTFGNESYLDDKTLNRKHIADIVFNDETQLAKLNALVHPAVFRAFDAWAKQEVKDGVPYVLKEAAVLFESGSYQFCDKTIMVIAPLDLRIKRVMHRDSITQQEVLKREARQFTEEQKLQLADYVIKNDESELVIPQVLKLHEEFISSLSH